MKHFIRFACISGLLAGSAFAANEDEDLGLSGEGQLGYVATRGNSETETLKIGANLAYNSASWRYSGFVNVIKASENQVDTTNRLELGLKADYKVSERSYWFGSARYEIDQFSQFDFQSTLAAGFGRKLMINDAHLLEGEVGLGYRLADIRDTAEAADEVIVRGALKYRWKINDTAALTNKTLIEAGSENTFASNIVALETKISSGFGLNVSYELRHNTEVSEPTKNSDFLTTVSLVYSF